jgi:ribosomal protein S12 methylthiotransferase accessory factor
MAALPSAVQTALALAATEVSRWFASGSSPLHDRLMVFDTVTLQTTWHTLVRRPQCPVCGSRQMTEPAPIVLRSQPRVADSDGGYRSVSAAQTFERYKHHVSPITGAVSLLERVGSPNLIHIYAAGPNKSRPYERWQSVRRSLRSNNAGKGIEDLQAKVSGLCEALERYSGVFQGGEPRRTATYRQLEDAIHPNACMLFSERQYAARDILNERCPPHLEIPPPFDEDRPVEWSPVWSLADERFKYLPTAFCYYDTPLTPDHEFCTPDSNGNAAGSSLEDAILQGFMELVERDSLSIWWDNRARRPGVDLDSFDHPYVQQTRAYYATVRRDLWLLDLTTDLDIPVFVALSRRVDQPAQDIIFGSGAHFDARVAALRAVTELNQMLPSVVRADRGTGYASESPWEIDWWQTATLASDPYLAPHPDLVARRMSDFPAWTGDDLRGDVLACVEIARRHEMDLLVLDQTRPDIGLPVVKVVVPGLRHFWRRYAPGRLYNVPVRLGWQAQPTPEAQMNPRPMSL